MIAGDPTGPGSPKVLDAIKDIQNVLGLLIAAFGGVLSFLGLGSAEVTAVIRNDTKTATIIGLFLLLSVLAAISVIAIPAASAVSPLSAIGVFLALLGVDDFAVDQIPVPNASTSGHLASQPLGWLLVCLGVVTFIAGFATADAEPASGFRHNLIRVEFIFIMASVVFLGISLYGALRAEAASQHRSSAQVSVTAATGTATTVSLQITAAKITATRMPACRPWS